MAAKFLVKFRGCTIEIPKNRSKFPKNVIFYLFSFPIQKTVDTYQHPKCYHLSRSGSCQCFVDGSKSKHILKLVNFEGLQIGNQKPPNYWIIISKNPIFKKNHVYENPAEDFKTTSDNMNYAFFLNKKPNLALYFNFDEVQLRT